MWIILMKNDSTEAKETLSNMKTRRAFILLLIFAIQLSIYAENILRNPLMSDKAANGLPVSWNVRNGTWRAIEGGFSLGTGAVAVQHIALPLDGELRIQASITATKGLKYRLYAEYWTDKKPNGTGERWMNSGADWIEGTGEPQPFERIFKVAFKYDHAHFAVMAAKGDGTVECRGLTLETFERPMLENADFKLRDGNGMPVGWKIRGASVRYEDDGADATIFNADGKDVLIFNHLRPRLDIPTEVTFEIRSEGVWRSYVEWYEGQKYCKTDVQWKTATNAWKPMRTILLPDGPYTRCILVFATQKGASLSIRNLKAAASEDKGALGGFWDVPEPHILGDGKVDVFGQKGVVKLRGIPVTAGKRYRVSYTAVGLDDARSLTGFHEINTSISPSVDGKFGFNDARNSPQRKFQTFTVPENLKGNHINLSLSVASLGTVRFSDFQLEEIPIDPTEKWELVVESPFYRNTIFESDPPSDIRLAVHADDSARRAVARLSLPQDIVKTADAEFENGQARIILPPWTETYGQAKLEVAVYGNDGKSMRTFTETLQRVPSQPREIKAHPNGYFTCNGEWLFPIVPFDLCCDDILQEMYTYAQNGITLIRHNYNGIVKEGLNALDKAQRCGVKLCFYIGFPHKLSEISFYKKRLEKAYPREVREHPAFFGYFIADEPLWGGISHAVFKEVQAIHQTFDPYHPTWINAAPRNEISELKPYGAACDIYGVDIYPVPWPNNHSGLDDKTLTACGKYAQRMAEIVNGRKPIINWLQGFSWHEFGDDRWNPANPKPYPTLMQSRFMAFDTLLNGGTGYGVYGLRYALHNEFIEEIFQVTRELNGMSRLFVEGKRLPDLKTTTSDLKVAAIEHQGKRYYFILNLTDKPLKGAVADGETAPDGLRDYASGVAVDFKNLQLGPWGVLTCGPELPSSVNPIPPAIPELEAKGSPFPEKIRLAYEESLRPGYKGDAAWIWDAASVSVGAECVVYKEVEVNDVNQDAFAFVAADDAFELFVNGKFVVKNNGWAIMNKIDIKPYLVKGTNHVAIHGMDKGGLPCGILAELQMNGKIIATDASWLTLPLKEGATEMPSSEQLAAGKPAKIITPYGGGVWRKRVKIH